MKESDLIKKMQKDAKGNAHIVRIENGASAGAPDLLLMRGGRLRMIECKFIKSGNKFKLQPSQFAFAHRTFAQNICIHYAILRESDRMIYVYFINNMDDLKELSEKGLQFKPNVVLSYDKHLFEEKEEEKWIN